jgi:GTP-binding protein EngB required for normal cell division
MFITLYWPYNAAVANLEAYVERIASHYLDRTQSIAELFDVMDKIRRPLNNDRLVRWLFH